MASDLYETLGVSKHATPEEIRKAYKKRALETHPDRHPNVTLSEKEALENSFRQVSNAYEVLNDPKTKREYDRHGVWPPPSPEEERRRDHHHRTRTSSYHHHHDPFVNDPFFNDPFLNRPFHRFNFTDPFDLFERMFSDTMYGGSSYARPSHRHERRSPWDEDPLPQARRMHSDMFNLMSSMHRNMLSGFSDFPGNVDAQSTSGNGNTRYTRQVYMSSSLNGATHAVKKSRDWNGNEIVTRTYPDGRKVVTINGVEQREPGYLPSSAPNQLREPRVPTAHQGYSGHSLQPPPPYPGHPNHRAEHREHRHRSRTLTHDTRTPVIPPTEMYEPYQHQCKYILSQSTSLTRVSNLRS
ncbi:hypothetical protein E1B28_007402 [Marasmius oreades]|uniref:J domain-containing protein n=1 Tax=Marasmius oreades TaxID=181124 RepID=A0A9P7UTF4_9AGAR|nr:uncharacterized protein E1B28_007402 [Marasmius oreades]KAG7093752.1 hypothetical protein E1B28_007402 [Marasmius oreades]